MPRMDELLIEQRDRRDAVVNAMMTGYCSRPTVRFDNISDRQLDYIVKVADRVVAASDRNTPTISPPPEVEGDPAPAE